jgi:hypothetical protein
VLVVLLPAALMMVAGLAAPAQAAVPAAPVTAAVAAYDDETGQALAAWDCATGNVCFWTGFGGTGSRCMWDVADNDWTSGTYKCSWATTKNVKSVYNAGTSSATGVAYYKDTGHNTRVGCTKQGKKGDLAGTYELRSHKWISTSCG